MRIAVLSDIHSNKQALQAVQQSIQEHSIDTIWSTGDFVDYGADPVFVMEWAISSVEYGVLGNHDAVMVDRTSPENFNRYARRSIPYTMQQLGENHLQWLSSLPLEQEIAGVRLVHASPAHPERWTYLISPGQAQMMFDYFPEPVCFYGHTHLQGGFDSDGQIYGEGIIQLKSGRKYLINPGSVGQPRDGDARWGYALYDTDAGEVELIRGEYNIMEAAKNIYKAGLPEFLGTRLYEGR